MAGYENLGPNVSQNPQAIVPGGGSFAAPDHSWEQLVIQQDKPAADWEINLLQAINGLDGVRRLNHRTLPSCWLNPGFLERSDITASFTFLAPDTVGSTTANTFVLLASDVNVNGWQVRFDLTQNGAPGAPVVNPALPQVTPGMNYVVMPPPPSGGQRTDLIILEVWRALVAPAPNATNKSFAGQILRYGNAKAPDSNPNVNLADDLIDPTYLQETARRVQIQYRYRVIENVDVIVYPDGLDSPTVFANTTPTYPSPGVDGAVSTYNFAEVAGDPGLWRAGTGNATSATALGTVDGYMYAVPICAISRRNSTAFNRNTNLNGAGLMGSAVSGRPDGLYADQIAVNDVIDLRKGIVYDFTEVLQKTYNELLDNTLATELEVNQAYGVFNQIAGTSFMFVDSITALPFNPPGHPGSSDGVRIDFSDRSATETIVATSGTLSGPGPVVFTIASTGITPAYAGASHLPVGTLAPANTNIVGLNNLRMVTSTPSDVDLTNLTGAVYASAVIYSSSISGGPVDTVTIYLGGTIPSSYTILADLEIEYKRGNGVSRNVLEQYALWTPPAANIASWVDPTQLTATSDATRFALTNPGSPTVNNNLWWMNPGHRELSVRLRTTTVGPNTYYADSTGLYIWIPEKLTGPVTIGGPTTTSYTQNTTYTRVTLITPVAPNTAVTGVSFTALRPLQPVVGAPGDSYQIWYDTRAIQSIPVVTSTTSLLLLSRSIAQQLTLMTSGSGSPDDTFPFVSPSAQIPVGLQPSIDYPESRLDCPSIVSVVGFGINSGFLSLPAVIPYTPDPGEVQLYVEAGDETIDGDNRNFWPRSDPGSPPIYSPVAWAQSLSLSERHKVALPVLMELKTDFNGFGHGSIGRQGTLVLVVFSRWGDFDANVDIGFQPNLSDSAAAVYRVPGNLLNPRRTTP
jgi:hypothetical protein